MHGIAFYYILTGNHYTLLPSIVWFVDIKMGPGRDVTTQPASYPTFSREDRIWAIFTNFRAKLLKTVWVYNSKKNHRASWVVTLPKSIKIN